jgi:sugar phosphate isomerase/epimerase
MLDRDDRVLCAGTVLPASIDERLDAAVAAGFTAVSLWLPDIDRADQEGHSPADVRHMIADAGLELAEVDSVSTWLPGSEPPDDLPETSRSFFRPVDEVLSVAEALGARSVTVSENWGVEVPAETAAEAFAALCDQAAEHGLLAHIEFMPWSGIRSIGQAWDVVRLADRPNGGILFDVWHHLRSGAPDDEARAVPGARILAVHLSDAPAARQRDLIEETMHDRLLPGQGDGGIAGKIRLLDQIGCQAPLGVEVISDAMAALPAREAARLAAAALDAVLDEARGGRSAR